MYNLLTQACKCILTLGQVLLPKPAHCPLRFMKEILCNEKRVSHESFSTLCSSKPTLNLFRFINLFSWRRFIERFSKMSQEWKTSFQIMIQSMFLQEVSFGQFTKLSILEKQKSWLMKQWSWSWMSKMKMENWSRSQLTF